MQLWGSLPLLLLTLHQELRSELGQGKDVSANICKLPTENGLCGGSHLQFYNGRTFECEPFYYSCCNGQDNFLRKQICEKICQDI
uniref:BPTI/Kunitz inhibitor domain-containing protein n=1 Tax=Sus scrofa TaxID=9823 RepID=A0A8D0T3P1_PIG